MRSLRAILLAAAIVLVGCSGKPDTDVTNPVILVGIDGA
jgi:PBP1b-binding outer membrane lipoprotein LpoB